MSSQQPSGLYIAITTACNRRLDKFSLLSNNPRNSFMDFKFNRTESFYDNDSPTSSDQEKGFGFKGSFADLNLLVDKGKKKYAKSQFTPKLTATISSASSSRTSSPTVRNPFGKKIVGDIFGLKDNFASSLTYRARNPVSRVASPVANKRSKDDTNGEEDGEGLERRSTVTIEPVDEEVYKHPETMNPKQQLAVTIRNWCMIPNNHDHVIREGGVHALVALTTIDDQLIRECCASAFYDLSSNRDNLRDLLAYGASSGVITLSMQQRSTYVL
jgi:hypothetical protein